MFSRSYQYAFIKTWVTGNILEKTKRCFQKACEWLETEASVQTMPDFSNKLIEYSGKDDVYDC